MVGRQDERREEAGREDSWERGGREGERREGQREGGRERGIEGGRRGSAVRTRYMMTYQHQCCLVGSTQLHILPLPFLWESASMER